MFTASSQRIESSMTVWEARSRGFQSNSREKHKQLNMRWTDAVRFREKGRRRDCGWEICSAFHFSLCHRTLSLHFLWYVEIAIAYMFSFTTKSTYAWILFQNDAIWIWVQSDVTLLCSDSYFCTWANITTPVLPKMRKLQTSGTHRKRD